MSSSSPRPLYAALRAAEPKPPPDAGRDEKKNYAQRLSNALARAVADALRPHFPAVTPTATGEGQEAVVGVDHGRKRLDVKVTDPTLGLLLAVSIKTYSFQDFDARRARLGRWTKNIVRNDHELRGEAMVLHQRQPYSVLVAVMFEPVETCDDGDPERSNDVYKSSFAHHVATLAKRSGRGRRPVQGLGSPAWVEIGAEDPRHDLFERVFVGLYETGPARRGAIRFFDVEQAPPRNGRPPDTATLSFGAFVDLVVDEVARRNRLAPDWAGGDEDGDDDDDVLELEW